MPDVFSKKKRSEVMSLIRSTNTKPEIIFRKLLSSALYPLGFRYKIQYKKLPGKPDVVFVAQRTAFFVDGSFWHGYKLKKERQVLSKKYWLPKIKRNMLRDKEVSRQLRKMGWKVIRVWEHDLKKSPQKILKKAKQAILEK
ncbi:MAG: very short patch repair endonuclease [Candidatus Magasanikbacteria bacterium]